MPDNSRVSIKKHIYIMNFQEIVVGEKQKKRRNCTLVLCAKRVHDKVRFPPWSMKGMMYFMSKVNQLYYYYYFREIKSFFGLYEEFSSWQIKRKK